MEQLFLYLSEWGFPVFLSVYLLHRIEAKLERLIESIQNLPAQLQEKNTHEPTQKFHMFP